MINAQTALVLWTLLAFQVKHLLCDFVLQTKFQVANKGFYGRIGGLLHAGCHALFTVPVLPGRQPLSAVMKPSSGMMSRPWS